MITYRLCEVLHGCSASARRNVKGEVLSPVSDAYGKRTLLISTMVTREEWFIRNSGSSQQSDGRKYDQVVPVASVDTARPLSSEERSRRVPQLEEAKQCLSSESQRIRCLSNSSPLFSCPFVYNEDTRVS